jgi:hypothetical protein
MTRGFLVTGAHYALGFVVSVATFGTLGACGGRYEIGEDGGGKGGTAGDTMTGGTGDTGGIGGTADKGGGSGGKGGGTAATGGGGTGGTEITTGGTGNVGETGGTGNAGGEPSGYVSQIRVRPPTKLDLLLMVDNSIGMLEKQELLAQAIPYLTRRLTSPDCVNESGAPIGIFADENGICEQGAAEFAPIRDIHIGVITSSVGDHGSGDICSEATNDGTRNYHDRAELLPTVRTGLTSYADRGFLAWDPAQKATPPGTDSASELTSQVQDHVLAAGQTGCGFEASLESWYRFLVDPEPVLSMLNDNTLSVRGPSSMMTRYQRGNFLRPDSMVAIVMLSDENDCSVIDENGTQGWLTSYKGGPMSNSWRMPRATSICAEDPNDPGCLPCLQGVDDPACSQGTDLTHLEDAPNLRCYHQKRRFGVDFLYPTSRYVEALTSPTIDPRMDGNRLPNPLFADPRRDPGSVVLMGIVGVPWQDLATEYALNGDPLSYLSASELSESGRWDVILGNGNTPPADPFMIESVDPRPQNTGHPLVPDAFILSPESTDFNPINGHEHHAPERTDLQHACIFPLARAKVCVDNDYASCECQIDQTAEKNAICQSYTTAEGPGVQTHAKAYPSTRQLQVLRDLGDTGVTTSICPNDVSDLEDLPGGPGWGYNPNMGALVDRLKQSLAPLCLPRPFDVDQHGRIACRIAEVSFDSCGCAAQGRVPLAPEDLAAARWQLAETGVCGDGTGVSCESLCGCEIQQLLGNDNELGPCQTSAADPGNLYGFCYVDPAADAGNPALVEGCPATQKRLLRFLGEGVPASDKVTVLVCDE